MASDIASDLIITPPAAESTTPPLDLPDSSWGENRLLEYMRQHDRAIGGMERKTLQHEFYFGAACQLKYEQLDGKWTKWADQHNIPRETFRRRRLVFLGAEKDVRNLDKYDGKMECYWDLKIYPRPTKPEDDKRTPEQGAEKKVKAEDGAGNHDQPADRSDLSRKSPTETNETGQTTDGEEQFQVAEDGLDLIDEIEEAQADAVKTEITVRLMASTVTLIDLLCKQERSDPGAVIFAAVREFASNHLDRKTWEKLRRGKSEAPATARIAG